jgi:colanic acid/amylovoran biosynthesis glycosyltransferase
MTPSTAKPHMAADAPLRIAFLVTEFPSLSQTFVLNQITGLLDRGHDVHIYADFPGPGSSLHSDVARYRLLERTRYYPAVAGNRVLRALRALALLVRHFAGGPKVLLRSLNCRAYGREASSLRLLHWAIPFLGRGPYDILHCHFGPNGERAALLRRIGAVGGKIVTTFHGADLRYGLAHRGEVYARLREDGDLYLTISEYNRRSLEEIGFDPARMLGHRMGVDLRRFPCRWDAGGTTRPEGQPFTILTVARLAEVKGIEYGLRAIHQLCKLRPGLAVRYNIVGEGALRGKLETLAAELAPAEVVTFLGGLDHEGVASRMQEADVFLLPSLAEALPVVLIEAQATGLPVVATDVGATGEAIIDGQSGFLVPPADAAAIADRLAYLADQPELWPQMGRAGRRHATANFDLDMLNDRLVAIFRELAGQQAGGLQSAPAGRR